MMSTTPPRAPTFPSMDDVVKDVDDSEFASAPSELAPAAKAPRAASTAMTDTSAPADEVRQAGGLPRVPLPVAPGKSRLRAVLMWQDIKLSGTIFGLCMLFFYLTLFRKLSILSVAGALLGFYLCVGLVLVQVNKACNGPLDNYLKKPKRGAQLFRREVVNKWADVFMECGNEFADDVRDVLYCEDPKTTLILIAISFVTYWIGVWFSPLIVLFIVTLCAFSLPLTYEKNKKQVDETIAKAGEITSRNLELGKKVATEKAIQLRNATAEKAAPYLEKAPPLVRSTAEKIGLGPVKKKSM